MATTPPKRTIPVGPALRILARFLPKRWAWVQSILRLGEGKSVELGGAEILLDQTSGAAPPRTGLDSPAKFEPPQFGGPRR